MASIKARKIASEMNPRAKCNALGILLKSTFRLLRVFFDNYFSTACVSKGLRQDRVIIKPFLLGPVQTECATKALINTQMPRTMIMLKMF